MNKLYDAKVMNAFVDGVSNVIKTMCGMEITPGKPFLKKTPKTTGDISGYIDLHAEGQNGIVLLSFSKGAILLIVSKMLSEEKTWIDKEVKDAVGELTNMVAGDSRKYLAALGFSFQAGIPVVIVGVEYEIYTKVSQKAPILSIPFATLNSHSFSLDFAFEEGK